MANSATPASTADQKICPKCKTNFCSVTTRGESTCKDCFLRYVSSKVVKRMDSYKVRKELPPRKVFLALSLGVSSLALLHILAKQLRNSLERIGRFGYTLYVCVMNDISVFDRDARQGQEYEERVRNVSDLFFRDRERWPMVELISYKSTEVCFNEMDQSDTDFGSLMRACSLEQGLEQPDHEAGLDYAHFIASLPSASARADINAVMTRRMVIREAQTFNCDTILWGDSTTRLAERTLAETAKGRGFSLPWQASDGPTPYGLDFVFPLRDLLRKEMATYAELVDPPLTTLAKPEATFGVPQASSKDATIDALMAQYFESVEENFPSIVANVVRTSSRLKPLPPEPNAARCRICALPVDEGNQGLHGWAGSQQEEVAGADSGLLYCYGCARSMQGKKV